MYREAEGVPRDYAEAVKWYRKAAEQGYARAQHNLRLMYEKGQGNADAQAKLGIIAQPASSADFQKGLDAVDRRDFATTLREWKPLAEQGHARAQFHLGMMYFQAVGVPQDYAEAMRWWHKAAEQGDGMSQYNLGFMYPNGQGVPQRLRRGGALVAQGHRAGPR